MGAAVGCLVLLSLVGVVVLSAAGCVAAAVFAVEGERRLVVGVLATVSPVFSSVPGVLVGAPVSVLAAAFSACACARVVELLRRGGAGLASCSELASVAF